MNWLSRIIRRGVPRSKKPILLVDFDGTLTRYSGWKGAQVATDPPLRGAIEFLIDALKYFDVCIYSARSSQRGGKKAMKQWLKDHFSNLADRSYESTPPSVHRWMSENWSMEPYPHDIRAAADELVKAIRWPTRKPGAFLTVDDRCLTFTGVFPDPKILLEFRPWNKVKV